MLEIQRFKREERMFVSVEVLSYLMMLSVIPSPYRGVLERHTGITPSLDRRPRYWKMEIGGGFILDTPNAKFIVALLLVIIILT